MSPQLALWPLSLLALREISTPRAKFVCLPALLGFLAASKSRATHLHAWLPLFVSFFSVPSTHHTYRYNHLADTLEQQPGQSLLIAKSNTQQYCLEQANTCP